MKKLFYLAVALLPVLVSGQSTNQNYVKTKVYKTATTSSIATPSETQATQSVTYFDGLGRPIQQVAHKQSATGKDIITHIEYDAFGRQVKEYLPYSKWYGTPSLGYVVPAQGETISYYSSNDISITGNPGFEQTSNPYSEKLFEASPLNRVLEQAAPGNDWAITNSQKHTIRFDYQANITVDEVKLYKATATWSATNGLYTIALVNGSGTTFYGANQLYKSVTKDENWKPGDGNKHTTQEFKDKEGRVVLKRTYGTSVINDVETAAWHETYYVYDQFGNLTYVIPPLVEGVINEDKLNGLCYQYKYDYRNRLVEKKLPGKQWEFIVYDKLDRVVMTGPALSPFGDGITGWMITKYDVFSRPILTAWMPATVTSATRKTNQDNRNTATVLNESKTTSNTMVNGVGFRYTTTALPTSGYHVLTVNYYDNYDTGLTFTPAISYSDIHGQALLNNSTNKPVGLPTVSWVRVPETATLYKHEKSYTLYDKKGRVVRTFKNNHLTGYTQTDQKLQPITGRLDFTETRHKRLSGEAEIYTKDVFTYTDQDRLLSHTHQIGTSGTPQLLAKNEYDELGQLISKQVGGTDVTTFVGLQKVDYRYNIRGWLKSINDVDNLSQSGNPTDLFAFKLNYNQVENATNYTGKALYNGNISETYWRTSSDNVKRKYGYFYDDLNRLKDAIYQKPNLAVPVTNSYNESLKYDKNGNITSLYRYGDLDDANYVLQMDNLTYSYYPNSPNQLLNLVDSSNNPNGFKDDTDPREDYAYDEFGNMEIDANKGITRISYNHLNLPVKITFAETKHIQYLYNATGQKISKTVTDGNVVTITEYLDGYQYIKPNSEPYKLHFFPHAEGYVNTVGGAKYVFNYTDHLGNIRLSYGLDGGVLKVLEENNYYPFGLKHENYNITKQEYDKYGEDVGLVPCVNCAYKYKYNGKEYQDELGLNMYDYGARNYDPAIGRWMNMDPLAEKHTQNNAFMYANNNPIIFIDPDGRDFTLNGQAAQDFVGALQRSLSQADEYGGTVEIDADSGEISNWMPLDKSTLYNYVKDNFCSNCSSGKINQMAGIKFENAFHQSMKFQLAENNYKPNLLKHTGTYKGKDRNVVPDGLFDMIVNEKYTIPSRFGTIRTPFDTGKVFRFTGLQFAEVKAMDGTLYNSTNQGQLAAMITAMAGNPAVRTYGGEFIIATTADTAISPNLISTASSNNINIIHAIARFRMSDGGQMQINFHHGNTPSLYFSTVK